MSGAPSVAWSPPGVVGVFDLSQPIEFDQPQAEADDAQGRETDQQTNPADEETNIGRLTLEEENTTATGDSGPASLETTWRFLLGWIPPHSDWLPLSAIDLQCQSTTGRTFDQFAGQTLSDMLSSQPEIFEMREVTEGRSEPAAAAAAGGAVAGQQTTQQVRRHRLMTKPTSDKGDTSGDERKANNEQKQQQMTPTVGRGGATGSAAPAASRVLERQKPPITEAEFTQALFDILSKDGATMFTARIGQLFLDRYGSKFKNLAGQTIEEWAIGRPGLFTRERRIGALLIGRRVGGEATTSAVSSSSIWRGAPSPSGEVEFDPRWVDSTRGDILRMFLLPENLAGVRAFAGGNAWTEAGHRPF